MTDAYGASTSSGASRMSPLGICLPYGSKAPCIEGLCRGDTFEFIEDTQLIEKRGERSTPCGCPLFSPDVEGRSHEDSGLPTDPPTPPHDPVRVSHLPVRQSVRHPSGVAEIEPHRNPESSGLRPSTSGLKNGHPCRGASYPTPHDELNDLCKDQMSHP